jgi:hypothetical protein
MRNRESAVGAKWTRIKGTSFPRLTPIVGDGMEVGGWVFPGNWGTRANVDECRGVIRGECANSNAQSRWGGYRKRTHQKHDNHQEDKPSSYQLLSEESWFSHRPLVVFVYHPMLCY